MFQIDLTMMRIQQNKIISSKLDHIIMIWIIKSWEWRWKYSLWWASDPSRPCQRWSRAPSEERESFEEKRAKERFVENGLKERPERKFALCQERPRQAGHCSRLGRWLGGNHYCSLWICYNCKIRWVGGWGRPFARLLQMSCLSWS